MFELWHMASGTTVAESIREQNRKMQFVQLQDVNAVLLRHVCWDAAILISCELLSAHVAV
jgi:hypothetical protein